MCNCVCLVVIRSVRVSHLALYSKRVSLYCGLSFGNYYMYTTDCHQQGFRVVLSVQSGLWPGDNYSGISPSGTRAVITRIARLIPGVYYLLRIMVVSNREWRWSDIIIINISVGQHAMCDLQGQNFLEFKIPLTEHYHFNSNEWTTVWKCNWRVILK